MLVVDDHTKAHHSSKTGDCEPLKKW